MCGISGFSCFDEMEFDSSVAVSMAESLRHRGPDDLRVFSSDNAVLSHARLAVVDIAGGIQPMVRIHAGKKYVITYNGELYNTAELRRDLENKGYSLTSDSDTEVLLYTYIHYADECPSLLNGIFAFAVWDEERRQVFLCRDRFGVKPLFYTIKDNTLVIASEIKAIFKYPGITPKIDIDSLRQVLGLGPARIPGSGVFRDIYEIMPGYLAHFGADGFKTKPYFKLEAQPHEEDYDKTVEHVRELLTDAVKRQLVSDVPLCTFLSGGLDSSIITAIAAGEISGIDTFSFDFPGNNENFKASLFQPDSDRPWVEKVSNLLKTDHHFLECPNDEMVRRLYSSVDAHDLPGMADIDSSLHYFCSQVKKTHTVALSGECADEVFGGYPWFHKPEFFEKEAFPWSLDASRRVEVLKSGIAKQLDLDAFMHETYMAEIKKVPRLKNEDQQEARRREISYLNIYWFMATLLERKDRMSMASGLEVRVPYADHRLVSYVFNAPWEYKCPKGRVKGLLRDAARGLLPETILERKKSPYPKTYDPRYELTVKAALNKVINDPSQPICTLLDKEKILKLTSEASSYGAPFFGQLMAGPQFMAWLLQVNYWLSTYNLELPF